MNIDSKQLASKPKKIGKRGDQEVLHVATKGGYHMILASGGGKKGFETLGVGPHKAVARHIADKKSPGIQWTDLTKGDHVDPESYEFLLPKYEALTDVFRARQGF